MVNPPPCGGGLRSGVAQLASATLVGAGGRLALTGKEVIVMTSVGPDVLTLRSLVSVSLFD